MARTKTVFKLKFKDCDELDDWHMILRTTEPKTEEEIRSLISYWSEVNDRNFDDFSPVNILDDICDDKGWEWEDLTYDELEIELEEWYK